MVIFLVSSTLVVVAHVVEDFCSYKIFNASEENNRHLH